jgi:DNA-binding response OmpR family regulator
LKTPIRNLAREPGHSAPTSTIEWLFGSFRLVSSRGQLSSGGSPIPLAQKSFELLIHLVRHRDRLVPWSELGEGDRFEETFR